MVEHFRSSITKKVKTFPVKYLRSLQDRWNGTAQTVNNYTLFGYFFLSGFFYLNFLLIIKHLRNL